MRRAFAGLFIYSLRVSLIDSAIGFLLYELIRRLIRWYIRLFSM